MAKLKDAQKPLAPPSCPECTREMLANAEAGEWQCGVCLNSPGVPFSGPGKKDMEGRSPVVVLPEEGKTFLDKIFPEKQTEGGK